MPDQDPAARALSPLPKTVHEAVQQLVNTAQEAITEAPNVQSAYNYLYGELCALLMRTHPSVVYRAKVLDNVPEIA